MLSKDDLLKTLLSMTIADDAPASTILSFIKKRQDCIDALQPYQSIFNTRDKAMLADILYETNSIEARMIKQQNKVYDSIKQLSRIRY